MKILHIASDNQSGGIQKAFEAYLSTLSSLARFENIYFTPNRLPLYELQYNVQHVHMTWMQKMLLRRAAFLPIWKLNDHSFEIGLAHTGSSARASRNIVNTSSVFAIMTNQSNSRMQTI